VATVASATWLTSSLPGYAQTAEESFPPNPLELTEPDPLLPEMLVDRPLSPQERNVLTAAVEELRVQADAEFQAGNAPEAFEIWLRELRLRRVLGIEEEVPALSRVGAVAWQENQTTEVRVITERLQEIELEVKAQSPVNYDLLLMIAQAYENMRAVEPAVALYQDILIRARAEGNRTLEQSTLVSLGELNLAWFNYPAAADAYLQLLEIARTDGDRELELESLSKLAHIYEQDTQFEQAIAIRQELVAIYEQLQEFVEIPPQKLAIGDNYVALNRPDLAAFSYQEAFAVSRSVQFYGYASDALQRLASLYRDLERPQDALVIYQLLIDVERQTYNTLGVMNAFDQIGQVHREMGNTQDALQAFQRGLQLAQELNYKVSYFTAQIQQLSQP
jgi:tetratricopeptide (TPR) repeat protein